MRYKIGVPAAALLTLSMSAQALVLEDRNSTVVVSGSGGMASWSVDGTDQLAFDWFWYRLGDTGPELRLDSLTLVGEKSTDADFDPGDDTAALLFEKSGLFEVELRYTLSGGAAGSGGSDVGQVVTITNTSGSTLDMSLFNYTDFDLNGTDDDDTAVRVNGNTLRQRDPVTGMIAESVATPGPSHYGIGEYPSLVASLDDASTTTLSDSGSVSGGNATWAWQWDFSLAAGKSFQISMDKNLRIPEPAPLLLLGAALAAAGLLARRRPIGPGLPQPVAT